MIITPSRRMRIFDRDGFMCLYCGASPPDVVLEVDHVIPRSRGGSNRDDNLATGCWSCNRGKRDHLMVPPGWDMKVKELPPRVKAKIKSRPFPTSRSRKMSRPKIILKAQRLCGLCGRTVTHAEGTRCGWCGRYCHPGSCYEAHKTYRSSPCRAKWQQIAAAEARANGMA